MKAVNELHTCLRPEEFCNFPTDDTPFLVSFLHLATENSSFSSYSPASSVWRFRKLASLRNAVMICCFLVLLHFDGASRRVYTHMAERASEPSFMKPGGQWKACGVTPFTYRHVRGMTLRLMEYEHNELASYLFRLPLL